MPICAIDMGSNTFRRIVGSFQNGRYDQRSIENTTLGVGDEVARQGRISDSKLAEIEKTLSRFKISCEKEGVARVVAIGTSAFREAANGARAVEIAAKVGVPMEIATERRESELAYLVGSLGQDGYAVIDNGSRSIELVSREGARDALRGLQPGISARARDVLRHDQRSGGRYPRLSPSVKAAGVEGPFHERQEKARRGRVRGDGGRPLRAGPARGTGVHARGAEAEAPPDYELPITSSRSSGRRRTSTAPCRGSSSPPP